MYRWLRKVFVVLFAVTVFGGGGLAWYAYVHYTDPETVRRLAVKAASEALPGSRIEVASASFCFIGGVRLSGIQVVPNADQGNDVPAVDCTRISLVPDRDQLLRGQLQFQKVILDGLQLHLHRDDQGVWNIARWIREKPLLFEYGAEVQLRNCQVRISDDLGGIPNQTLDDITASFQLVPGSTVRWEVTGEHSLLQQLQSTGTADTVKKTIQVKAECKTALDSMVNQLPAFRPLLQMFQVESLGGSLGLKLTADLARNQDTVQWNGRIEGNIHKGNFRSAKLPHPVTDADATFTLTREGLDLPRLRFIFGPAWGEISAQLPGWDIERMLVNASMWGLPLDNNLYRCLPERQQSIWEKFSPSGKTDLRAQIRRRDGEWQVTGDASLSEVSIRFFKFPYPVLQGTGRLVLHPDGQLTIDGQGMAGDRNVNVSGRIDSLKPNSAVNFVLRADQIPIDQKLRQAFVELPEAAQTVLDKFDVAGQCNVTANFTREEGQNQIEFDIKADITCSRCVCAWFPYPLQDVQGTLLITRYKTEFVHFTGLRGRAAVQVGGKILKTTDGPQLEILVSGRNVPLDATLKSALQPQWLSAWDALQPRGSVGIDCLIVKQSTLPTEVSLSIDPKDVVITPKAFPYELHNLHGRIRVENGQIHWSGVGEEPLMLAQHGDNLLFSSRGSFQVVDDWAILSIADLKCMGLTVDQDLRRAVPETLGAAFDFLAPSRPIDLQLNGLEITWPLDHSTGPTTYVDATIQLRDTSLIPSVGVNHVSGTVTLAGSCSDHHKKFKGEIVLSTIEINGFRVNNLTTPLEIDGLRVDLPKFKGDFYSGKVTGEFYSVVGDHPAYQCSLNVVNASLRNYVWSSHQNPPSIDGIVDAGLMLTGSGSTIGVLNGAGSIRIRQADIYRFPVIYDLVRLVLLEEPNDRVFDDVLCDFTLRDQLMLITKLELTGPSLSLMSEKPGGRMNLKTNQIAITMKTRWAKGRLNIPLISETLNTANDQLGLVQVRGTLQSPDIWVEAMPGVRKFFENGARMLDRIGR